MSDFFADEYYQHIHAKLKSRLDEQRFTHSLGVAQTAGKLAEIYGVDIAKAHLAGLLHDWDKCLDNAHVQKKVKDLNLAVDPFVYQHMPWLLHGITAAATFAIEMPEVENDVLQAIARHTSAATDMTDLDMVLYVADVIEPSRPYKAMEPLRELVGEVSLENLFLQTFRHVFSHLVDRYYMIHPDTVAVWNCCIQRTRVHTKEEGNL